MRHFANTISTLLAATFVLLWPAAASAQSMAANPSVDQVRSAFVSQGYQVDRPLAWDWASPPVTTFRVADPARDRLLMVLVYANPEAARIAEQQTGGRLVLGFGPSSRWGNVALVQTNSTDLGRAYRAQKALDDGMDGDRLVDPPRIGTRVDFEFLQALDSSVATL